MAAPSRIPISLFTIILLLVPGLVGLELYYIRANKRNRISRIQWIVYSVFLSLFSLTLLYLFTPVYFNWITTKADDFSIAFNIATEQEILGLSFFSVTVLYAFHLTLTFSLGFLAGFFEDEHINPNLVLDRRPPWEYAFKESASEQVEVSLDDETVIRGRFHEAAWDKENQDLYIEDPEEIKYKDGSEVGESIDLGRSVLLTESAIDYVIFTEEDPDSQTAIDTDEFDVSINQLLDELLLDTGQQATLMEFSEETQSGENDEEESE